VSKGGWRYTVTSLLICLTLAFVPPSAADVSGVWNLEMQWAPNGTVSTGACTLKQNDGKLTGKCAEKSTVRGEVRDRQLTWAIEVDEDSQKGRMSFEGTLDESGTTIRGKCAVADGPTGTFTMKRQ
jgi:hypothetical protein